MVGQRGALRRGPAVTVLAAGALAGCASDQMVVTEQLNLQSAPVVQGIPYYLPEAAIPITVSFTPPKPPGSAAEAAAAKAAAPSATATASPTITVTVNGTKTTSTSQASTPASAPTMGDGGAAGAGGSTGANAGKASGAATSLSITIGSPQFRADSSQHFFLRYTKENWADDTFGIHVNNAGLLTSVNGEAVDQTAQVGAALVETAVDVAKLAGIPAIAFAKGDLDQEIKDVEAKGYSVAPKTCAVSAFKVSTALVPRPGVDLANNFVPTEVSDGHQSLGIKVKAEPVIASTYYDNSADSQTMATPPGSGEGILFRDWLPWDLTITVTPAGGAGIACKVTASSQKIRVFIPNGGKTFYEDMSREPLIDKKIALAVSNGMLTGVDVTRPSLYLALAKFPVTLLQPILSAPLSGLSTNGAGGGTGGGAGGGTGAGAKAAGSPTGS